jgi:hypothetical protein
MQIRASQPLTARKRARTAKRPASIGKLKALAAASDKIEILHLYRVPVMTRKFPGDMKRKLSLIESRKSFPLCWNFITQEPKRGIGELGESRAGIIVCDVLVHHAP